MVVFLSFSHSPDLLDGSLSSIGSSTDSPGKMEGVSPSSSSNSPFTSLQDLSPKWQAAMATILCVSGGEKRRLPQPNWSHLGPHLVYMDHFVFLFPYLPLYHCCHGYSLRGCRRVQVEESKATHLFGYRRLRLSDTDWRHCERQLLLDPLRWCLVAEWCGVLLALPPFCPTCPQSPQRDAEYWTKRLILF